MMVKKGIAIVLCTVMVLVASSPAQAQFRRRGQGGGAALERLTEMKGPLLATQSLAALRNASVQDELRMSDEQRDRVGAIASKLKSDIKDKVDRARRNPFTANPSQIRKEAWQMLSKANRQAYEDLNTDQRRRLKEVCVQIGGSLAAANEQIQDELGLSQDQKTRIQEALKSIRRDQDESGDRAIEDARDRIDSILTPTQRTILRDMAGAPFKLSDR